MIVNCGVPGILAVTVPPAIEGDHLVLADPGLADRADLTVRPGLQPLQGEN